MPNTLKPVSAQDRIANLRKTQPEASKEPEKAGGEWERSDKGAVLKGNFGAMQRRLDATLFEDIRGAAKLREKANLASVIPTIESAAIDGLNDRVGMNGPKQHFQKIADYLMARKGHAIIGAQTQKIPLTSVFLQGPDGAGQREYAGHLAELFKERSFLEGNEKGEIFEMTASAIASKGAESAGKAAQGSIGAVLHITELDGFKEAGANGKAALQTLRNFAADNEDKISIVYSGTKDEVESLAGVDHRFNTKLGYTVPFEHLNDLEIGEEAVQHAESRGYKMGRKAVAAVVEHLSRERETGNFANKTRVASMVDQAILQRGAEATDRGRDDKEVTPDGFVTLTPKDFPLREAPKETALERIKRKYVGNAEMKAKLDEIAETVRVVKEANPDTPWEQLRPQIMNLVDPVFVLVGPTGTGKTTLARDLGEFLGELDLLPDGKHFMEVGQADLSDRYIGGAVQNTRDIHNRAKGGVLFTDEAYAVMGATRGMGGGPDPYGKQIIDEFVRFSTHPDYMGKMAWVYAGYKAPMQDFFKNNEGFANRVKHIIEMEAPDQNACVEMFLKFGERENVQVSEDALQVVDKVIGKMRGPKFGNGRDIENLYKKAIRRSIVNGTYTKRVISAKDAQEAGEEMLKDMAQTRGNEEKKN